MIGSKELSAQPQSTGFAAPFLQPWPMALAVGAAAVLLIMVLPLYVPVRVLASVSTSAEAGFNNSVAIVAAAGLSVLVFSWAAWRRTRQSKVHAPGPELMAEFAGWHPGFLPAVLLVNGCILALCEWLVIRSGLRYLGDSGYILEQATVSRETGRALYSQIEFAYGPLLLWPVAWISRILHCGMPVAYLVTLVLESSLGLLLLAYVLGQIPMRPGHRRWALLLFALTAITPHLGLNYTFFRFASPLAVLLFATRRDSPWQCAALLCVGEALELAISPELALVLTAGALVFTFLRAWHGERTQRLGWIAAGVLPVASLAVLLRTTGSAYLQMAASLSRGALNLPVGPYPHIVILLIALVWLVPFSLGSSLSWKHAPDARLLALYVSSLAFMQAALGRSDPVHVVFNGIGIFALSLFGVRASSRRVGYAWIAALAFLAVWHQFVNQRFFQMRTAAVLAKTVMPRLAPSTQAGVQQLLHRRPFLARALMTPPVDAALDMRAIDNLVGSGCVATPLEVTPAVEDQFRASQHWNPGYFAFWVNMMSPAAERRSIRDAAQCDWMLLPPFAPYDLQTPAGMTPLQGYRVPYRIRNPPAYLPGSLLAEELRDHWRAVGQYGPYTLFHKSAEPAAR